jgi:integrase
LSPEKSAGWKESRMIVDQEGWSPAADETRKERPPIMSDNRTLSDMIGNSDLISDDGLLSSGLAAAVGRANEYAQAATAANTRRAYRAAWAHFAAWCGDRGLESLPASPTTVGLYLADVAEALKVSTLRLRLAAISRAHRAAGGRLDAAAPEISLVLSGIVRTKGAAVSKKEAVTDAILRDAIRAYALDETLKAKRDRTILALGFFAALRRSEIAAIDAADLAFAPEGVVLTLRRRKSDQEGLGFEIGLPAKADSTICPVAALAAWLEASGVAHGPVFRSITKGDRLTPTRLGDRDVARIVKAAAAAAGYDAAAFGGHSLRSGFITAAARKGVPERLIANQSGHRSVNVLRGYVRRAGVFNENAAAMI